MLTIMWKITSLGLNANSFTKTKVIEKYWYYMTVLPWNVTVLPATDNSEMPVSNSGSIRLGSYLISEEPSLCHWGGKSIRKIIILTITAFEAFGVLKSFMHRFTFPTRRFFQYQSCFSLIMNLFMRFSPRCYSFSHVIKKQWKRNRHFCKSLCKILSDLMYNCCLANAFPTHYFVTKLNKLFALVIVFCYSLTNICLLICS